MQYVIVDTDGVSGAHASLGDALTTLSASSLTDNVDVLARASTGVDDTSQAVYTGNTTANYRLRIIRDDDHYRHVSNNQNDWLRLAPAVTSHYVNVTVSGIPFVKTSISANYQTCLILAASRYGQVIIENCSFLTPSQSTYRDRVISLTPTTGYSISVILRNNRIHSRASTANTANACIYHGSVVPVYADFNTIIGYRGWYTDNASAVYRNNIVKTTVAGSAISTSSDYNMFSGAFDSGGAHDHQSHTFTFVDEANEDFHLSSSDAGAQNLGVSLSGDSNDPVTTDADGVSRSDPPDCGAYEVATVDNTVDPLPVSVIVTTGSPTIDQPADNSVSPLPVSVVASVGLPTIGQPVAAVIIDHTHVAKYADIPASYKAGVKEKWVSYAGESHSGAIRGTNGGPMLLAAEDDSFAVAVQDADTPEAQTSDHLRVSRGTWGDQTHATGWRYGFGEEDWYTNAAAIAQVKTFLSYAAAQNLGLAALGFGWCWDMTWHHNPTATKDSVYKCGWAGSSVGGPEDDLAWGLDAADSAITGNSVCLDTYLAATQEYIDYCEANGLPTIVFFTTGPVDSNAGTENGYQRELKQARIRSYVEDHGGYLFDFADILAWDNAGGHTTSSWTDAESTVHTFDQIAPDNLLNLDGTDGSGTTGYHFGERGALRLGKALWVMLAMMDGWDGEPEVLNDVQPLPVSVAVSVGSPSIEQALPQEVSPLPVSVAVSVGAPTIEQVDNTVVPLPVSITVSVGSPVIWNGLGTPQAVSVGAFHIEADPVLEFTPSSVLAFMEE